MIIINFKNYKAGKDNLELAKKIKKFIPKSIVSVPTVDIASVYEKTRLETWAQHVSYHEGDKNTGFVLPESVKAVGAKGTLVNHAEHRIGIEEIEKTLIRCKKNKLKTLVCVGNFGMLKKVLKLKEKPWGIAFEDPKLISTGHSITNYNPKAIKKFVKIMKKRAPGIKIICGAGVSDEKDVSSSKEMGCEGVLIASAIAKPKNPEKLLKRIR